MFSYEVVYFFEVIYIGYSVFFALRAAQSACFEQSGVV